MVIPKKANSGEAMTVNGVQSNGSGNASAGRSGISGVDGGFADILRGRVTLPETRFDGIFEAASQKYGIPLNLLKAVAKVESSYNPKATSRCGAMGVMQLMPGTAKSLGVSDAYDPGQNIMGGAKYLRQMLDRFDGDTGLALAAYNAGPGSVKKYGGIPPFAQGYVNKVLKNCGGDGAAGASPAVYGASAGTDGAPADTADAGSLASLLMLNAIYRMLLSEDIGGGREDARKAVL